MSDKPVKKSLRYKTKQPQPGPSKDRKRKKPNESTLTRNSALDWRKTLVDEKLYSDTSKKDSDTYSTDLSSYKNTDEGKICMQPFLENKMAVLKLTALKTVFTNKTDFACDLNKNQPSSSITKTTHVNKHVREEINEDKTRSNNTVLTERVPVFTKEFLELDKKKEDELKHLDTLTQDYKNRNSVMHANIAEMKAAMEELETNNMKKKNENAVLRQYIEHLRTSLLPGFSNVPLPDTKEVATLETIDDYMEKLYFHSLEHENEPLREVARDIISNLDLGGQNNEQKEEEKEEEEEASISNYN